MCETAGRRSSEAIFGYGGSRGAASLAPFCASGGLGEREGRAT